MEAGQIPIDGCIENTMGASNTLPDPVFEPSPASSTKKMKVKANNQVSQETNTTPSVSNSYVFKCRLIQYAQKAGLKIPFYETIEEGPSYPPSYRATVILDNVRYHSLPGFSNRKAAEQSAAEVALLELADSITDMKKVSISVPENDTGECKTLLLRYAQKMKYAMPLYECKRVESEGKLLMHSCVVEIGGNKYIGNSTTSKKDAEFKAARTALLAIQSAPPVSSEDHTSNPMYTLIPKKMKVPDLAITTQETKAALKPKKGLFKKKLKSKNKSCTSAQGTTASGVEVKVVGVETGL